MRARRFKIFQQSLAPNCALGHFLAPTLIEISSPSDLEREVFGPVLHVLRYPREKLVEVIDEVNASGYGLTGGAHSRIDSTIELICGRLSVGNLYVNRNIIGAAVGVQPFGGRGLSGTGPKAGGPLYMKRLLAHAPAQWSELPTGKPPAATLRLAEILRAKNRSELADHIEILSRATHCGLEIELQGPVGESNIYTLHGRGAVLCDAESEEAAIAQIACALATGNRAILDGPAADATLALLDGLPIERAAPESRFEAALTDRRGEALIAFAQKTAQRPGPIVSLYRVDLETIERGDAPLDVLLGETSICINTTAAGGNASLMSVG
jgi:RHH-type proline utilization regulon transcriptional repressor/proline dehydrogenase/delta 1-pyrroline-5-carboxylate dehydrogenase